MAAAQLHPFDAAWVLADDAGASGGMVAPAALARAFGRLARSGVQDRGDALEVDLMQAQGLERVLALGRGTPQRSKEAVRCAEQQGAGVAALSYDQMLSDGAVGPLLRAAVARAAAMDDPELTMHLQQPQQPPAIQPQKQQRQQCMQQPSLHQRQRQHQQYRQQHDSREQRQPQQHSRACSTVRSKPDLGPAATSAPVDLSHLPGGNVASTEIWGGGSGGSNAARRSNLQRQQPSTDSRDDDDKIEKPRSSFMTGSAKLRIDDKKSGRKRNRNGGSGGDGGERNVRGSFRPPTRPDESSSTMNEEETEEEVHELYRNIDPKYIEQIQNEVLETVPDVQWDDIAGLKFAKTCVTEMVILPIQRPDIFKGLRGPPKGLLLFGPPGTGKTLICKAIASQSNSKFFSISASTMTSKWMGEGEKLVRALFAVARVEQPSVIFIDEIDSLLTARSEGEYEGTRRIKTEFLVQWDGAGTSDTDRVLVVGATNRPGDLDEAARRRLVKRIYIPLPDEEARLDLVKRLLAGQQQDDEMQNQLTEDDLQSIVLRSAGYSGADMANLCKEAAMGPIRSVDVQALQTMAKEDIRPIMRCDFDEAFHQVRASVSSKDLEELIEWDRNFGSAPESSRQDAQGVKSARAANSDNPSDDGAAST